jgi:hypothetical protein
LCGSETFFILLELDAPSAVLIFSNRFGCGTIVETMEFSDEDSDYSKEASNEVNDEDKNSLLTMLMSLLIHTNP